MDHQSALTYQGKRSETVLESDKAPDCTGELDVDGDGFWDDVRWVVYKCRGCNQRIATVGGGQHWWNYILTRTDLP
jgi:hypothetical protein